jgi:vitamin B12/bleomycin/antimicrobial peptide transport system ATP-binding/permease protein
MIDRFLTRIAGARSFAGKLWVLTRPYWYAEERQRIGLWGFSVGVKECWIAQALLAASIVLSILIVYISKLINSWNARFFNALQERNAEVFWSELGYWVILVALFIVAVVYRTWLMQLLTIRWRRWLSQVYFRDWLADRTFYHMELTRRGVGNPEQRIEQDCNSFTSQTLNIALGLLLQVMTLVTFAAVLWNLSSGFMLPLFGGINVPGYMMWAAVAYAVAGSWATYAIGRPLVRINFALERYNADFRYRMVRIRENAESIALYHGEPVEARRLSGAFTRIFATWWAYMRYNKRLTWLTSFYGQAATIFPYIVAAPQYFAGQIGLGTLTQTADAFGQVQGSLSWFVDSYTQLAAWKATVDRLTTFGEAMVAAKRADEKSAVAIRPHAKPELQVQDVDLALPDGTPLLRNVNLAVRSGETVVLRGPSGSGKTTLFRALAGLWPFGRGRISTPPAGARVLFVPQRPYLPIGTLKDALCYPDPSDPVSEAECHAALEACGLWHLSSRLNETANWSLVLSGGEKQRLAFARALVYRPDWLFLDEATSALDEPAEKHMYELVRRHLPRATVVSIAHRPAVAAFHDRQINIDPAGQRVVSETVPTSA